MKAWLSLADIRREYGELALSPEVAEANPFDQFKRWFEDAYQSEKTDPTAMVLSTVDEKNHPDSRVVLLKGIENESFVFYTNYESTKGQQLKKNSHAALNFYWPQMARQVRVRGLVKAVTPEESDHYFAKRPLESQLAAKASNQSKPLASRDILEKAYQQLHITYRGKVVPRPANWGGYALLPDEMEFWQGRDNRLHDRLRYVRDEEQWQRVRLAP